MCQSGWYNWQGSWYPAWPQHPKPAPRWHFQGTEGDVAGEREERGGGGSMVGLGVVADEEEEEQQQ